MTFNTDQLKKPIARKWFLFSLASFCISTILGVVLRYFFIGELPGVSFKNLMHAHSHVGMLGWLFSALFLLIWLLFVPGHRNQKRYTRLFYGIQLSVLGMLLSFPFEGYGLFSITFSTVHMLLAYAFIYSVYQDTKPAVGIAFRFLRTALFFMCFSTLGVWSLGPVIAVFGRESHFYDMAIQFFLHFQFNGWFIFASLALFFRLIKIQTNNHSGKIFYYLLLISCLLTYLLTIPPTLSSQLLDGLKILGVMLQLTALFFFILLVKKYDLRTFLNSQFIKYIYHIAFISFILKILVQSGMVFLEISGEFTLNRFLILGFIHLILLGAISFFIIGVANVKQLVENNRFLKVGWLLLIMGFIGSELLIFMQGLSFLIDFHLPHYHLALFIVSALMPLGILIAFGKALYDNYHCCHMVK